MDSSSNQELSIAVDAMGNDLGTSEIVAGVSLCLQALPNMVPPTLVGDEKTILRHAQEYKISDKINILHASQVIGMDEKPIPSLKQKKDSSMVRAIELVKEKKCGMVLSCGNTGSLMAGSTLKLRPMEGIERPALATIIPTHKGHFVMIDAGANPEPRPEHLLTNAILGKNYAKTALGISNPRVGLLTIGTEEGKGTELIKDAHSLLDAVSPDTLNYSGLIEGFQVFENTCDVVLCDGFTGNVVLKICEGLFGMLTGYLKEELTANPMRKAGAMLAKPAFMAMKNRLSPEQYGGAPLLGLRGLVMKSHGSSTRNYINTALQMGTDLLQQNVTDLIRSDIDAIKTPTNNITVSS